MTEPTPPAHERKYIETITAFILRARRVEEHSIAQDKERMVNWAHGQITLHLRVDGTQEMVQALPEEEPFESLAARVRPILLEKDPVSYKRLLPALKYFLRDLPADSPLRASHAALAKEWEAKLATKPGQDRSYSLYMGGPGVPEGLPPATDSDLAMGWFYGDLVHADADRRERMGAFGIRERYRAAVGVVAAAVFLTVSTMNFIRTLEAEGLFRVPAAAWEEKVTVGDTLFRSPAVAYLAERGTPVDLTKGAPSGFTRFTGDLTAPPVGGAEAENTEGLKEP